MVSKDELNTADKMENSGGDGSAMVEEVDLDDPQLEEKLVGELKAQGVFDQFRSDCLADVDTKVC